MRFGWVLPVTLVLIAVACSGGGGTTSSLGPLPVEGLVKGSEFDCDSLAAFDVSFVPSKSHREAEVYAVNAQHVDSAYVAELAQKLGISGQPTEQSIIPLFGVPTNMDVPYKVPSYVVKDKNGELVVEQRTGNLRYYRAASAANVGGDGTVSEESAKAIAEQLLRDLGLPLPGGLAQVTRQPGGQDVNLVWLPKGFHAIQTYTPLAIAIGVANDGAIQGMDYFWQDLQPIGKYPLASEADALKRLRRCDGIFTSASSPQPAAGEVRVEYMGVPPTGPFQYFVPVYHFGNDLETLATPGAGMDRAIAGRAVDAWVLAIADEFVEAPPSE